MRHVTFTHDGREYRLRATFEAGEEIAEKVADPFMIAREAGLDLHFASINVPYQPKFMLKMKSVRDILAIGFRAAGEDASKVQDLIMDMGLNAAKAIAEEYLVLFFTPSSQKKSEAKGDAKPGE